MTLQLEQVAAALPSYEIGEELGRGSTGVVLAARHRQLGRDVAVKLLPPDLAQNPQVRRRFVAEAKLLASFSHVHIVPVYDYVEQDGLCLLVMERLSGGTLDAYERAGLDAAAGCAAVVALCSGLQYAHERGVLHRDVKPGNVLVAQDGLVKVSDFGIAKVLGGSETLVTRAGFVLGTPAYMAPEQAKGIDIGPATDIYGAGIVLYELLANRLPFPLEGNPLQMLYSRIHTDPQPLLEVAPQLPPELAAVVMRALEREPDDRHESADAFGRAIDAAAAREWGPDWQHATPFAVAGTASRSPVHSETVPDPGGDEVENAAAKPAPPVPPTQGNGATAPPAPPGPPPAAAPPPAARGRRRIGVVLGVLVLLALAGGAIALLAGGDDPGSASGGPASGAVTPTPDSEPASGWQAVNSANVPRQQAPGAVDSSGKVWVLGGLGKGPSGRPEALSSVEGLDTVIGQWGTGAPDLPERLHHAMAATYDGEVVVIGGWIQRGSDLTAVTSDRVWALRVASKWVELPRMNSPRVAGGAAVVDDKLVVVGGQADNRLVPTTEVFDGKEWKIASDIPTPREHLAAASDGRYVYAVGGRELDPGKNLTALERYDPVEDSWTRLPDMPSALGGLGAAIVDGRLVAVGGETSTDVLDTTFVYDIAREKWSSAPRLRTPRHGMTVIGVGNTVYALDGAEDAGHTGSTAVAEALSFEPRGKG